MRFRGIVVVAPMLVALALINTFPQVASAITHRSGFLRWTSPGQLATTTPIKHLVVLFQENVSFDHYFGTYPHAANLKGETKWFGAKKTPKITGLTPALLTHNPNLHNPIRLDAKQAVTCDQSHTYSAEQHAENGGRMNEFVQYTSGSAGTKYRYCPKGIVMGHYDGNVVTALWNYAQHYVLSDNSWGTTFGPSTVGAINLASGDTGTALCGPAPATINTSPCTSTPPATNGPRGTVFSDADPYYDQCSNTFNPTPAQDIALTGANIGTLLDRGKVSWGWFQGGFGNCMSASPPKNGPVLGLKAQGATPAQDPADQTTDYSPHHDPFQYYASTANPQHLPPTSVAMVGQQDQANHQYDLTWFGKALAAGNLPAVSFLKAPRYQDGHAGTSDPLDEQYFLVNAVNIIEKSSAWASTAIIIAWDDSDGWYDHAFGSMVNQSNASIDFDCGKTPKGTQPGRCGYGPRLPLLVISPYAKSNFVDHSRTDQTSIIKFIEDNWLHSARVSSESFDRRAGSLGNAFTAHATNGELILNALTGR